MDIAIIHALDWGSGYHQAVRVDQVDASAAFRFFMNHWVKFLGAPKLCITDAGTEFTGKSFKVGMLGVYQYVCDTRAPWQNGRTERSGGELKRQIKYLLDKLQPEPQNREEIDEIISQACMVRNQSVQKGGYSPMQRLFGYAPLEPMCFGSAAREFPLLWEGSEEALERAAEIRKAALESYTELSSRERLQRAARALHRAPPPQLSVGQKVLVWRKPSHGRGEWVGPAQVVAVTNTGAFVAVRGVLWKVA
eukprot:3671113-Amphidinium_carterae.1